MDEILSQWPRFSFDSYMILEFQAMSTSWPNVQCTAGNVDDIGHTLLKCNNIESGALFLLESLKSEIPDLTFEHLKYLDFRCEDLLVPTYLTAATLSQLWISRFCTRNFSCISVRANVMLSRTF